MPIVSSPTGSMRDEIVLRPIVPGDVEACGRIAFAAHAAVAAAHGYPPEQPSIEFSSGLIGAKLKDANAVGVLAERRGAILGSVFLTTFPGTPVAAIGPLTVDPAAEVAGAGFLLTNEALEEARRRAIECVRLVQSPSHLRSLALYVKCGFELREPLVMVAGTPRRSGDDGVTVRKATPGDAGECDELAARILGFARTHELRAALDQGVAAVALHAGKIVGYTAGMGLRGHAVASETAEIAGLIGAASSISGPGFFVPVRNGELLRTLFAHGFRALWPAALMSKGRYQEPRGAFLPSIAF